MVRWVFTLTLTAMAFVGCSRHSASQDKEPARDSKGPPTAKESSSATTFSAALATPLPGNQGEVPNPSRVPKDEAPVVPTLPSAPRSLAGKKVLHVGDSMVGGQWGLTRAFEAKLTTENATIVRHTKVSETVSSFDKTPTLRDLLRTHEPDIVVITLGANDSTLPHPEVLAHSVQNIVKRVGDRECWWLGPPMADTGIVKVIRDNAGACRFFDASKLELERASDGIHPNDRGAGKWAEAFWQVFRSRS